MQSPSSNNFVSHLGQWLATPLHPGRYLALVNPLWSDNLCGRIEALQAETADAVTLVIRANHLWQGGRAGQYVRLGVDIDGVRHWRCYSLNQLSTGSPVFHVTVGKVSGGRVSTYIHERLCVGDLIHLDQPAGDFCLTDQAELAKQTPPKLLFISAGTGITPVMGMLRSLTDKQADIVHLHFAPDAEHCLFANELASINQQAGRDIHTFYTRQGAKHFDATLLKKSCPDWQQRQVYVCGPLALMKAAKTHWQQADLMASFHQESFMPEVRADNNARGGEVKFYRAERGTKASGNQPLLEVAEGAGLLPAHGCRMGICAGCLTTLQEGQVRNLNTGEVFGEPGEQVRICICAAAGDVTLDL